MLPTPASFDSRFNRKTPAPYHQWRRTLLARSRATNLALGILGSIAALSLLLNLRFWLLSPSDGSDDSIGYFSSASRSRERDYAMAMRGTRAKDFLKVGVERSEEMVGVRHLIVVTGHAVWHGCEASDNAKDEEWILEEYQKGTKSIKVFFEHIRRGVELALKDESSLLVFSGGQTRRNSLVTEASSYYRLAHITNLFNQTLPPHSTDPDLTPIFPRATTEDYALDSYQNLLFSIARFREVTGTFPRRITVIGFDMKRRRFEDLHRNAIRWPRDRFGYVGVDLEGDTTASYSGERMNGYLPYERDLYGCHDTLLEKRTKRNPFLRFHSYYSTSPELAALLDWCPPLRNNGARDVFPGYLPWDKYW
ncbi:hypothetical protein SISSUDRAFT_1062125 [Sistotremastrum suecicum HHB10207 ss-3]|uniref:DUF218 domain-containing protein n=1 Tax=Sistotremastrum suecicum HHB10207 ss-3 TaxID=1314776 RepID=A0A166D9W0_9AGAM|nr:hypothetical protein SISSUDRAFT_1062125 [Sistotremastrum suecicum HHB10207 ss-3]